MFGGMMGYWSPEPGMMVEQRPPISRHAFKELLDDPAAYVQNREREGSFLFGDASAMFSRLLVSNFYNAVWVMCRAAWQSTQEFPEQATRANKLMGVPALVFDGCPHLGSKGDVVLVDLVAYTFGPWNRDLTMLADGITAVSQLVILNSAPAKSPETIKFREFL